MYGWSDFGKNGEKGEKMGRQSVWLRGEGEENWWDWLFFFLGLPKFNLPKLRENENENEEQKVLGILDEIT